MPVTKDSIKIKSQVATEQLETVSYPKLQNHSQIDHTGSAMSFSML